MLRPSAPASCRLSWDARGTAGPPNSCASPPMLPEPPKDAVTASTARMAVGRTRPAPEAPSAALLHDRTTDTWAQRYPPDGEGAAVCTCPTAGRGGWVLPDTVGAPVRRLSLARTLQVALVGLTLVLTTIAGLGVAALYDVAPGLRGPARAGPRAAVRRLAPARGRRRRGGDAADHHAGARRGAAPAGAARVRRRARGRAGSRRVRPREPPPRRADRGRPAGDPQHPRDDRRRAGRPPPGVRARRPPARARGRRALRGAQRLPPRAAGDRRRRRARDPRRRSRSSPPCWRPSAGRSSSWCGATGRLAGGDLGARVEAGGPGELQELARSFNAMAADLDLAHRRIETERRRLDTTVRSLGDGLLIVDADGVTTMTNPRAAELVPGIAPGVRPEALGLAARRAAPGAARGGARRARRADARRDRGGARGRRAGDRLDAARRHRARAPGAAQERVRRHRQPRAAQPADVDQGLRRAAGGRRRACPPSSASSSTSSASRPTGSSTSSTTSSTSRGSRPGASRSTGARPTSARSSTRSPSCCARASRRRARSSRSTSAWGRRGRWPTPAACARS